MFLYSVFEKLCSEKGVSPYLVSRETDVATSTLTNWKKGNYIPKIDKVQKIADFFGVPLEMFMVDKNPSIKRYQTDMPKKVTESEEGGEVNAEQNDS